MLSSILDVLGYVFGAVIFYLINILLGIGFLILCTFSLLVGMKLRCRFCFYYGKRCYSSMGGKITQFLFSRGNSDDFKDAKNLVPTAIVSFAVLLLPVVGAVILVVLRFSWFVLTLFMLYMLVAVIPGFYLRKNLFCRYCNQGKIGCPAYQGMQGRKAETVEN